MRAERHYHWLSFCRGCNASLSIALLAIAMLLVGSPPFAWAFAQSFYRDCIGAVTAAEVAYQKALANYRLCAGVADAATDILPIRARMRSTSEALAATGFVEPYLEYGHAYYSLYKYYAFSNPRSVNEYLAIGFAWRDHFNALAETYGAAYREAHSAELLALIDAQQLSLPEQGSDLDDHRRRVALEDANFWIALYGTHWAQTKWHYNTGLAQHSYNVWSYYGAPLYGTYAYLSQTLWAFVNAEIDAGQVAHYSLRREAYPEEPTALATRQAYEAITAYYEPVKKYYGGLVDYYRDLTEDFEG
jgi:hypothetical protein